MMSNEREMLFAEAVSYFSALHNPPKAIRDWLARYDALPTSDNTVTMTLADYEAVRAALGRIGGAGRAQEMADGALICLTCLTQTYPEKDGDAQHEIGCPVEDASAALALMPAQAQRDHNEQQGGFFWVDGIKVLPQYLVERVHYQEHQLEQAQRDSDALLDALDEYRLKMKAAFGFGAILTPAAAAMLRKHGRLPAEGE